MSEQSSQHHPPLFGTSVANRSSSCVNGLYTENAQAPSQANGVTGPYLIVVEQPSERCRFRYKAEQTAHLGVQRPQPSAKAKQKCCPKVQLVNYSGAIGEGWHVVARLYTNEAEPRLHVNDLWRSDSEDGICVVPIQPDGLACFPNVVIMRQKEKDVAGILYEKLVKDCQQRGQTLSDADLEQLKESANREHVTMKDCLHSVRFGFHAVFTDQATGQSFATPVTYSEPIFNTQNAGYTELRIAELDKSQGSVAGGDSIWLRCASKVRKDQVRVRFHEPATGWEAEGQFTANEVYEQILIIFTTPPYRDVNITEPVHVNLHLFRAADGELSPPINFVYMPADDAPNRKRRRMVPTFGPDNYGYRYDGQAAPSVDNNASSTWGNYYGTASELNAYQPSGGHHEPYYQNYTVHGPHSRPSMSVGQDEQIGVDEIKQVLASATGEGPARIQHIMSELWKTNLTALWLFASEGDPQAMVSASRHLIGWQNDADGCTSLHVAARSKQSFALRTLLTTLESVPEKASVINQRNNRGQTPLHSAVRSSDADSVHYLISAGAERTAVDIDGNTVAHYLGDAYNDAIYKDILDPPEDTVAAKQKLDLGLRNAAGVSPLHIAVKRLKLTLLEDLIDAGAPVNVPNRCTGWTALHSAADIGDLELVECLLKNKAEVNCQANDGCTPLHLAVRGKHEAAVMKLVQSGADPDLSTAVWPSNTAPEDEEVVSGESTTVSPRDLAADNDRLTRILNGEKLLLVSPSLIRRAESAPEGRVPASPSTTDDEGYLLAEAAGGRDLTPESPRPGNSSFSEKGLQDDLCSLDFVTRLRLSKLLDSDGRWERLASAIECEHMIEFIKVCAGADEGSPTILLLDQCEQMPSAKKIPDLMRVLERLGEKNAVELLSKRQVLGPDDTLQPAMASIRLSTNSSAHSSDAHMDQSS